MHIKPCFFLLIALCPFWGKLYPQNEAALKKTGLGFFAEKKYDEALVALLVYESAKPGDTETLTKIGVSYYQTNRLDSAGFYLQKVVALHASPPVEAYLFLAKVYHARLQFEDAVRLYKVFLKNTAQGHPFRLAVKDEIRRCATGLKVRRQEQTAAAVNLGDAVNSEGDEFQPAFRPGGQERIYFSSSRPRNAGCGNGGPCPSDIFYADMMDGDWTAPKPFSVFVNSIENEIAIGFDQSGSYLYFFRGKSLDAGDFLVDTLRENVLESTLFFDGLESPMHPWTGDKTPFFFHDTVLLFASRRAGGFGGLDLYAAVRKDGTWSEPENLGPAINSIYDETSPFLAQDGHTLYFSTNDVHRSIGGMDILKSTYLDRAGKWMPAQNLGPPINSAGDDGHFILKPDGKQAFFSSSRKTGLGGHDLYVAIFYDAQESAGDFSSKAFILPPDIQTVASQISLLDEQPDVFENDRPLVFSPVYYLAENGWPLQPEGARQLQRLSQLLKKFPQAKVILAVHCDKSDPTADACEGAQAQTLQRLWESGAPIGNVLLRQVGAAYPANESQAAGNRRIEIYIPNVDDLPYDIRFREPASAAPPGNFFRKVMSGLSYRLQIPFSDQASLEALRKHLPQGMVDELPATGQSFFMVGLYLTFQSAEEMRKELGPEGFPSAEVRAFLKGWEISKEEAMQLLAEYPDLRDFVGQ